MTLETPNIMQEFRHLQNEIEGWQQTESHNDESGISIYMDRISTPDWMEDCFLYTVINTQTGEMFEGSWDKLVKEFQPRTLYLKALSFQLGYELAI